MRELVPVLLIFNEFGEEGDLGDEFVMRESEGEMGWFHRKFNPGTGAAVDTVIHGETTIAISDESGKVIGHIVFREGPPPETQAPATLPSGSADSTAPGQSATDSQESAMPQPAPATSPGATTSSQGPTPGGQSGSGSPGTEEAANPLAPGAASSTTEGSSGSASSSPAPTEP